jgi:hypothetical protein
MRVYVASSWRCVRQPEVVRALRAVGNDVYDFKHPAEDDHGFGWKEVATETQLRDPRQYRDEVLATAKARAGFETDMRALRSAEATVLVLPCGRSAHLELGYAVAAGQRTFVLLDEKVDEPELMYLMCSGICLTIEEVVKELRRPWRNW